MKCAYDGGCTAEATHLYTTVGQAEVAVCRRHLQGVLRDTPSDQITITTTANRSQARSSKAEARALAGPEKDPPGRVPASLPLPPEALLPPIV